MELLQIALEVIGVLLAASLAVTIIGRFMIALIYPLCALSCLALLGVNASILFSPEAGGAMTLPFGLPGVGVHLRLDVLSAFFGIVVNLGGALSSLCGIGYGRGEQNPLRILPFY